MSTNLEFFQELPKLNLPTIKNGSLQVQGNDHDCDSDSDECNTPTSEEHRIPAVVSCPPAPRKPPLSAPAAAAVGSCKRKLTAETGFFFDVVNRDEVDSFFRSAFEAVAKRRCSCAWR